MDNKKNRVTLYLPCGTINRIKRLAKDNCRSVNQQVALFIKQQLQLKENQA